MLGVSFHCPASDVCYKILLSSTIINLLSVVVFLEYWVLRTYLLGVLCVLILPWCPKLWLSSVISPWELRQSFTTCQDTFLTLPCAFGKMFRPALRNVEGIWENVWPRPFRCSFYQKALLKIMSGRGFQRTYLRCSLRYFFNAPQPNKGIVALALCLLLQTSHHWHAGLYTFLCFNL